MKQSLRLAKKLMDKHTEEPAKQELEEDCFIRKIVNLADLRTEKHHVVSEQAEIVKKKVVIPTLPIYATVNAQSLDSFSQPLFVESDEFRTPREDTSNYLNEKIENDTEYHVSRTNSDRQIQSAITYSPRIDPSRQIQNDDENSPKNVELLNRKKHLMDELNRIQKAEREMIIRKYNIDDDTASYTTKVKYVYKIENDEPENTPIKSKLEHNRIGKKMKKIEKEMLEAQGMKKKTESRTQSLGLLDQISKEDLELLRNTSNTDTYFENQESSESDYSEEKNQLQTNISNTSHLNGESSNKRENARFMFKESTPVQHQLLMSPESKQKNADDALENALNELTGTISYFDSNKLKSPANAKSKVLSSMMKRNILVDTSDSCSEMSETIPVRQDQVKKQVKESATKQKFIKNDSYIVTPYLSSIQEKNDIILRETSVKKQEKEIDSIVNRLYQPVVLRRTTHRKSYAPEKEVSGLILSPGTLRYFEENETKKDFLERQLKYEEARKSKIENRQKQILEKEKNELVFSPTINQNSKNLDRSVDSLMKWVIFLSLCY